MSDETPEPDTPPTENEGRKSADQAEPSQPEAQPAGEGEEEDDEVGIDPRVLLVVGVIVLIIIVIYWGQSRPPDVDSEAPAAQADTAQTGQTGQTPPASQAPRRPPSYGEFLNIRRQQAAQFLYQFGDRQLALARPPTPAQKVKKGVIPPMPGQFFDITRRRKGVLAVDLFRRQTGNQPAFRDAFPPLGLPLPKEIKPVFKKAADLAGSGEGQAPPPSDSETVIGVKVGNAAKAYPKKFLCLHDVINDVVGETPVVLVYSGVAGATSAYVRQADGKPLRFGCSGLIYQAANVVYDQGTLSLWSGLTGEGLTHEMTDRKLEQVSAVETSWSFWRSQHPDTLLMTGTDPKLGVPYGPDHTVGGDAYHRSTGILYPVNGFKPGQTAQAKTVVFGLELPQGAKAYDAAYLSKAPRIEDKIGDAQVVITYDPATGHAQAEVDGKPVVTQKIYWFAWVANHPKSLFKGLERMPAVIGSGGADPLGPARMGTPNVEPEVKKAPPAGGSAP